MKSLFLAPAVILLISLAAAQPAGTRPAPRPGLTLITPDIADGGIIPPKYTHLAVHPVSPAPEWTHVPAGTVTFALIMHDPDAAPKRGSADNLHWVAFNIPGTATGLPENVPVMPMLPDGTVQAKNLNGIPGYDGPGAGPAGPYHHYTWELAALNIKLELGPEATRQDVLKAMDGHILGKGVTFARFHR